ncbi:serine/threonine-protein phosphatase 6 regulatory ankyrin repeat subunit A-like isoform X3 [Haliotis rubra]|uniref:serine/threonine-protein phosphatase 6 regulatory ankyrin repeat subunit A-like isoform X3 n=1 Tax=Haliotis rubra TaxID=36100 RepID=UPI001EE4EC79|nr:serine/threonine-protein phosphatase 6 regulatory ankyrin repeat subunit A-like isoform X3 [Haliotis rubra]
MTTTTLTTKEKESIINSFWKRNHMFDISSQDKNTITQLHENVFGFPLICQLYCTNPAFQIHKITYFFQNPVSYLRGDLDTIIREGSSRSAALVLLVLCGGKLDLVSFKSGTKCAALFQVVKEEIASCNRTDIGKEIRNFIGTYCTVENHVASFSHPSIHDAAACALGHLNEELLLEHCSLQLLYERVRLNRDASFQSTHTDDVTNMIYITSSLHPLVISRLVQGVREGCFRWTVGHSIFSNVQIASSFLTQIMPDLPEIVHRKDTKSGECFLYWVSVSTNHSLFEHSVSLMCRETYLSNSIVTDFYDSIIGCIQSGNLLYLQRTAAALKQLDSFDVDRRTKDHKTLLMVAAEAGQLDVFNFLLKEGADVSATDNRHCNCLHFSCKSGSKDIVNVLIKQSQHLINVGDEDGVTPAILCAESGQVEILKLLVSHKADLTNTTEYAKINSFHIGCSKGHVSVVKYLLTCEILKLDMRGGRKDKTAVMLAASRGLYDVYNLLVSEGADLSLTDSDNSDCFMLACKGGNMSIEKHLLSLETFDINKQGGAYCRSAVMMAASRGHYDVYNLLVSKGADLSLTDSDNDDCLMMACMGGNMSIVKHLLSLETFDINRQWGMFYQSAVMVAASRGHDDVYNLLVSEGADLSLTDISNSDCFMLACQEGKMSIVKHLLSLETFDINRQGGNYGKSAVMMAAARGYYDVYNLLVSEGADLSLTDTNNSDCLMLACGAGDMSIVKHVLSLETFDINRQRGADGQSAVMMAAARGYYDIYNLLVSEGADLSLTDTDNSDCLMLACWGGNMSIVKHLLSLETFDINRQRGADGQSGVMIAASRGHYDVYNLLVSEGTDLSMTDKCNSDCLILACEGGNMSIVKHLLSLETFDINRQRGADGQSAVMMAASRGHYDVYNLLVSEGADLSLTDTNNSDCFMLACKGGKMSIVKHLLSLETFDINRQESMFCESAVMMAAATGYYDIYNLLVSEGADLSLTDKYNRDCLMLAYERSSMSIVKHLLSLETLDINRQGATNGQSAVMMAASRGHYDVYNLLVSKGADLSMTDTNNSDCFMLACEGGNMSIVKHLLSLKTFGINRQWGISYQSAVMVAASRGHYAVYNLLVSEGADLSLTATDNSDCLMLACRGSDMSIVKHLLSLETFDINRQRGADGQSAVMMAASSGLYDVYNLLVSEGADLSLTDKYNSDCLLLASRGGKMSIVKHLLSLETFDINRQRGADGKSAVMMAAARGYCDVYNLLVSEGADLSLTDTYNSDCLMSACGGGNMSIVKHLLSLETFDINRQRGADGQSAVMMAASRGLYDVYNLLVSEGADLSLTDKYNSDCLMMACGGGNMSIVKHLLSLETFDINRQRGADGQSAVMMAASRGHYDVYNLLVSKGADLSLTDTYNSDCLMSASWGGNMSIVKHLLSLETFDINRQRGADGQSAVMMAASRGHYDVYNLLVSKGADLSLTDTYNSDCLMSASWGGNMSIVKHLLSLETFDINRQRGADGQSAVMMAASRGHDDVYNLLVSEGADLSLTDKYNRDCLMLAYEASSMSIVEHLLSLETFVINRQGGADGQSAVMMAASRGHYDVYNLLVSKGADLSMTDTYNSDCFMLACEGGNMSIVKHLLSLKTFDINRQGDADGQSAVMMAASKGHYDVYNLLVSEGADLSLTDKYNSDCLILACGGGNMSIVKHLLSLETFDINRQGDADGQSAVMMAASKGHYDVYNLLVSEGADLSLTDKYNSDCLMLACGRGNMSIVKHLLSLETFDINRQGDADGQSAVMMAASKGHYDVYNLLVSEGADLSLTDTGNSDCLMLACYGDNMSIVKHLLSLKQFGQGQRGLEKYVSIAERCLNKAIVNLLRSSSS